MTKHSILDAIKSLNEGGSIVKPKLTSTVKKLKPVSIPVKPTTVKKPIPVKPVIELFLNPRQVKEIIKQAELEGEVIVVRCKRKTSASKPGGPDAGQLYDLHCGTKPAKYKATKLSNREEEDDRNTVLTVFATNRQDRVTKTWGAWRRVNLDEVQKLIYRTHEYEVTCK
jgi:hypothetical protein